MTPVRCAIYTRKSSEEGLEQGFNSLDAQREACAAYILSQASEGWQLIAQEYDDGGISGGTLQRPALQQLLADVAAGKVDIIVVYKVDRLTRSLLDFAKLVEALDKAGTSFVSITQSFNTTTSMGRLTLNMLLSFAQFEREVTAERIRDKVAASKAKGMWMGGIPPLGYRPDGRSLAIAEEHADLVRDIYARYAKLKAVRLVADQLVNEGIKVPPRTTGTGRALGGGFFSRGQINAILKNPIYVGDIPHRGKVFAGNHPPIIPRAEWDQVQHLLAAHVKGSRSGSTRHPHPLAGLLIDEAGEPLIASHTSKGKRRYRYYVSKALHHRTGATSGIRLPAQEIEQVVAAELAEMLDDPLQVAERLGVELAPADILQVIARCKVLAASCRSGKVAATKKLVSSVRVLSSRIELAISSAACAELLGVALSSGGETTVTLSCAVRLTRTGRAVRLVQDNGAVARSHGPDPALLHIIAKARRFWTILAEGKLDVTALARQEGVTDSYISKVVRLAFLSPQVIDAILSGRTRAEVNSKLLLKVGAIHSDWSEQENALLAVS